MDVQNKKQKRGRISLLHDDLLGLILRKLVDKYDRRSFSRVCKRWLKLEHLNRLSLRVFSPEFFRRRLLTEFPNAVHIVVWYCGNDILTDEDVEYIIEACPQIETLKVRDYIWVFRRSSLMETDMRAVGNRCLNKLNKVSLRGANIREPGVVTLLDSARNLISLTMGDNKLITDHVLCAVASSSSIRNLKLKGCMEFSDDGIKYLAEGCTSKNLKKLVVKICNKGCCSPRITDMGLMLLRNMSSLEHLHLSLPGNKSITNLGGVAISEIQTLKELKLHRLRCLSDTTIIALAENCHDLEMLYLTLVNGVTKVGIHAFSNHIYLKHLVVDMCNFDDSDLESMRLGLPSCGGDVLQIG